jgi:hypothetical protein
MGAYIPIWTPVLKAGQLKCDWTQVNGIVRGDADSP